MSHRSVEVFHLVWRPFGIGPLERFVASYHAQSAGEQHRLTLIFNGFESETEISDLLERLPKFGHNEMRMKQRSMDLECYRAATMQSDADYVFFLNSYCEILSEQWLAKMMSAACSGKGAIVGATGSWESRFTSLQLESEKLRFRSPLLDRLRSVAVPLVATKLLMRFPRFPNPHLRTNAFGGRRAVINEQWPQMLSTKEATFRCESGRQSLTKRLLTSGHCVKIVGKDGRAFGVEEWPAAGSYASRDQENLLIADNQTEKYRKMDSLERASARRKIWGEIS